MTWAGIFAERISNKKASECKKKAPDEKRNYNSRRVGIQPYCAARCSLPNFSSNIIFTICIIQKLLCSLLQRTNTSSHKRVPLVKGEPTVKGELVEPISDDYRPRMLSDLDEESNSSSGQSQQDNGYFSEANRSTPSPPNSPERLGQWSKL